jgi:hypothetical protein
VTRHANSRNLHRAHPLYPTNGTAGTATNTHHPWVHRTATPSRFTHASTLSLSPSTAPLSTASSSRFSAMVASGVAPLIHSLPFIPIAVSYGAFRVPMSVARSPVVIILRHRTHQRCDPEGTERTYRLQSCNEQSMTYPPFSCPYPPAFASFGSTHSISGSISRVALDTRAKTTVPVFRMHCISALIHDAEKENSPRAATSFALLLLRTHTDSAAQSVPFRYRL